MVLHLDFYYIYSTNNVHVNVKFFYSAVKLWLCFPFLQFNMDRVNAEEFLEVYKGVVAEYTVSIRCCTLFYDFSCSTKENMGPLYFVSLIIMY